MSNEQTKRFISPAFQQGDGKTHVSFHLQHQNGCICSFVPFFLGSSIAEALIYAGANSVCCEKKVRNLHLGSENHDCLGPCGGRGC